jgi:hypothetical protein
MKADILYLIFRIICAELGYMFWSCTEKNTNNILTYVHTILLSPEIWSVWSWKQLQCKKVPMRMIIFEIVQFWLTEYCSHLLVNRVLFTSLVNTVLFTSLVNRVLFTSLLQSVLRKWGQYWHMNKADNSGMHQLVIVLKVSKYYSQSSCVFFPIQSEIESFHALEAC